MKHCNRRKLKSKSGANSRGSTQAQSESQVKKLNSGVAKTVATKKTVCSPIYKLSERVLSDVIILIMRNLSDVTVHFNTLGESTITSEEAA